MIRRFHADATVIAWLARASLPLFAFWGIFAVLGSPSMSGVRQAYDRLVGTRSLSASESALAGLIIDEQVLHPMCSACTAPTTAPQGHRLADFPGAVFARAKLRLEESSSYVAAPGSYFTNSSWSSSSLLQLSEAEIAGEGRRLMDEVSPSGEIKPLRVTKDGYYFFVQLDVPEETMTGDAQTEIELDPEIELEPGLALEMTAKTAAAGVAEPMARADASVAEATAAKARARSATYQKVAAKKDKRPRWRHVVYQPLGPTLQLEVSLLGSTIDSGDWVVLYGQSPASSVPTVQDVMTGRAQRVTTFPGGNVIEVNLIDGELPRWFSSRVDRQAAVSELADVGFQMMSFKPDASEGSSGGRLSAEHERRLFQPGTAWQVPESALDHACSVDRAPRTACVWVLLAGEAVPVQVDVVELASGQTAVLERRVFAGKGIAPPAWQRLSIATRRAWLMQVTTGNSIFDGGQVFVTPWRG